jgi:hypothetical protein
LHFFCKYATLRALKLPGKPGVLWAFFLRSKKWKSVLTGLLLAVGAVQIQRKVAAGLRAMVTDAR